MKKFIKKHKNLNIVLSTFAVIFIWRGTWSITDLFLVYDMDLKDFWAYFIPLLLGFWYLFWNDSKLTELLHSTESEK